MTKGENSTGSSAGRALAGAACRNDTCEVRVANWYTATCATKPMTGTFFFFVVAILATAAGRALHPMHYFFFGCAFFAFHLLFAYLVDVLDIRVAFAIAAVTTTPA